MYRMEMRKSPGSKKAVIQYCSGGPSFCHDLRKTVLKRKQCQLIRPSTQLLLRFLFFLWDFLIVHNIRESHTSLSNPP